MMTFLYLNLIFILIQIHLTNSFVNYALGKPVTVNGGETQDLTDGNLTELKTYSFSGEDITIKVPTGDNVLSYMVIHVGDGGPDWKNPEIMHYMDHLDIKCDKIESTNLDDNICGELSTRIYRLKDITKGIRINMISNKFISVNLSFPMSKVHEVKIAEIELYIQDVTASRLLYSGCFTDFIKHEDTYAQEFKGFEDCVEYCEDEETIGISKHENLCLCGIQMIYDKEVNNSKCKTKCSGKYCGGNGSYSIYLAQYNFPFFIGCYTIDNVKPPDITIQHITVSKCFIKCMNSSMIGIKIDKCGCIDHINSIQDSNRLRCNRECFYDDESMCGGANGVNVYGGCMYYGSIDCFDLLNCKNATFNHLGVCKYGCLSGYSGEHCMIKIDTMENTTEDSTEDTTAGTTAGRTAGTTAGRTASTTTGISENTTEKSAITTKGNSVVTEANYISSISAATLAIFYFH